MNSSRLPTLSWCASSLRGLPFAVIYPFPLRRKYSRCRFPLFQVKQYKNSPLMMASSTFCESHSPLSTTSTYGSHPLINHRLCGYTPGGVMPSTRVSFPIQLVVSMTEPLSHLVLSYSMQACGVSTVPGLFFPATMICSGR